MVLGYVIRNYIPEMRIETLHFWLVMAGYWHTFFGQRGGQIEESAEQGQVVTLEWEWGFRDTLCVPVCLSACLRLGALLAAGSSLYYACLLACSTVSQPAAQSAVTSTFSRLTILRVRMHFLARVCVRRRALGNVIQMGATFAAASQLGNEPGFVTSFAAGVAYVCAYRTARSQALHSRRLLAFG